ncbi:VOC family protein [Kutzneria sp. CA-103260]|uniref:VOC family protein n=1 Tax=Kutzneria sp. CA-103260 TaxID=2802641 RepID=UPI001BA7B304|nr:VOC family protein [Kutzneria sp. CA-103260]QUQ65161.1 VOC family protein [Kutzneria sp. CA-103260]
MVTHIAATTIDCADPERLAGFWSAVLGYSTAQTGTSTDGTAFVEIGPADWDTAGGQAVLFEQVPNLPPKVAKNRVHLDVAAPTGRYRIEVQRIIALGATEAAIGQRDADLPWTVLADPEGNEFCVLNRDHPATVRG